MRRRADDVRVLPPGQGWQDSAQGVELPAGEAPVAPAAPAAGDAPKPKYGWRCTVCGHIEYVDELPDDFVCPVCGVGKDMFERVEL